MVQVCGAGCWTLLPYYIVQTLSTMVTIHADVQQARISNGMELEKKKVICWTHELSTKLNSQPIISWTLMLKVETVNIVLNICYW